MEEVVVASVLDYRFVAKPNCSLSRSGRVCVVAVLAFFSLTVAAGFSLAGAWLVFPFAGLELMAVGYAFYHIGRHADDYESISIQGDELAIEVRDDSKVSRSVFHCYWARVELREGPGNTRHLWLCSHGKEIEVGRFMSDQQRSELAGQLKKRTGAVYHG